MANPPLLVVLSGPSGVGKDALLARLRVRKARCYYMVTATTRPKRAAEIDGQDYQFLSPERFQAMKEAGEFLEWAQVYGHWYGVPRGPVRQALARGRDVFIKADVQGAATLKRLIPGAVPIFLAPPSLEVLEARLRQRQTEAPEALQRRLAIARQEMECLPLFDYVVVNDRLEESVAQVEAIVIAEKCRVHPRRVELP